MELDHSLSYNGEIVWKLFSCKECDKFAKIYSSKKVMENDIQEKALVDFWISELSKKGYRVIKDTKYNHHGEVILRALQDDLSSLEMKILGEVNRDQTIIYLQPESCCSLADEYKREPVKLPLIQLPANTKNIKYFDYFPFQLKISTLRPR